MTPIASDRSAPQRSLTVLVVEDEIMIAMDLEMTIERHGWRVLGPAMSVVEALRLLENERPDVALLDVNLRGEMVTPVAFALRSLRVPFVLSSAYDPAAVDGVAVLAGAPKLAKPVSERRLVAALAEAAGRADAVGTGAARDWRLASRAGDRLRRGCREPRLHAGGTRRDRRRRAGGERQPLVPLLRGLIRNPVCAASPKRG